MDVRVVLRILGLAQTGVLGEQNLWRGVPPDQVDEPDPTPELHVRFMSIKWIRDRSADDYCSCI